MTAQRIDGKALAKRVRAEVAERAQAFEQRFGRKPGLDVVLVGEDPASQVYVRSKERAASRAGLIGNVHRLPAETTNEQLLALVRTLAQDASVDGILVQLPLPKHLDETRVLDAIPPEKDVDGLTPHNLGLLTAGRKGLRACTPSGSMRMLKEIGFELEGKRALVIGRSLLVGKSIAFMLLEKNATVTLAHSRTQDLAGEVGRADLVVAAVGRPGLVRGEWLKPGAVVIDVGINRLEDGSLTGDVDFEGAVERASFITPVPGGVGPMTIAMLLSNAVDAAEAIEAAR
ncbi:MAG: bifunctional methylenetetrahydrofolate dehydrogenase/methenyltetrahydrofolate cyclohydrolase FolD [Deltaproteobacteria bacterium]|nr:bifunctional methylenetetrahydrofolate dehydrogenase/methenyltetrahydrofolate cyclohydrolase FolD [Deltaproteobacteria bacterium]